MATFLDNTIYTNYALSKITRNIVGNYENFNFLRIKIGSGDSTLSMDRTDLTTPLYSLRIKEVFYENGIVTIKCEIPPELAEIPITEIGLYDTVLGIEHLFSYSKIEIVKPSDLGYELTVVLNLGPKTIKFPGVNVFEVKQNEYVSRQTIDLFRDMFILVDTNLERTIYSNAEAIGHNIEEVTFEKQIKLNKTLEESSYANIYYALFNKYKTNLSDLYFLSTPDFLSYQISNFTNEESYLDTYLGLYSANNDTISFHDGPVILAWNMKLDDIGKESTIFNKKEKDFLYFSVDLEHRDEIYKIETIEGQQSIDNYATYHELVIYFYGANDTYEIRYILDRFKIGKYVGSYLPYILTFNGDFNNPEFHLYIDGEEPEILDEPSDEDSKEVQDNRQESDLFNKIVYGNESVLVDMPDYSRRCPLKNYFVDYETNEKYAYDNGMCVKTIMALKKQATKHDIAFLSSVLRSLGELN